MDSRQTNSTTVTLAVHARRGLTRCAGCLCLAFRRGGSSTSNLLEPHHHRDSKVLRVLSHSLSHMSSGWFDCTEPSLSTLLQEKQGVQGAYALVLGELMGQNSPHLAISVMMWFEEVHTMCTRGAHDVHNNPKEVS